MEKEFKLPEFADEDEEARWWFDNRDLLTEQFIKAAADGRLTRGTIARRAGIPTTTIRLDPADIARARVQAERRGLRYQTYLKMLIHEALQKEAEATAAYAASDKA
jgi:predicted DNA binding CopG/RHH family protein